MELEKFSALYERFSKPGLTEAETETADYEAFVDAIQTSEACNYYYLQQQLRRRNFDYSSYCCLEMAAHVAEGIDETGEEIADNPEIIMRRWDDLYGIPVHNGSGGMITIRFCPWCGKKL